ncbi:MAG: 23S rRNA (guanosine(2251)-2'-O)-methyltransferase RlmB [Pseudomonadales bacterium]|nr:23S rRNA (guanosine(2251)-2'-O)-methyltransferase RlmB [Pseudomonadales bacterium]
MSVRKHPKRQAQAGISRAAESGGEFVFGVNAVMTRLSQGAGDIRSLRVARGDSGRVGKLIDAARALGIPVETVDSRKLDQMTGVNHQGVALEVTPPRMRGMEVIDDLLAAMDGNALFLILDGVQDPGNLGAIIRSAATLGVDAIIVPQDNSAPLNAAAIKIASGGASLVPVVQVVNLARAMEVLKAAGVWTVGTVLETETTLEQTDLTGNLALVMGSEERGIREKTRRHCDFLATIPMPQPALGFNVSVATGICLYETQRQRAAVNRRATENKNA